MESSSPIKMKLAEDEASVNREICVLKMLSHPVGRLEDAVVAVVKMMMIMMMTEV